MMYDDVVFDDRFRYQLTMFEMCTLIWLARLLDTHIAYELALLKITTYNWYDSGIDLSRRTAVKR